MAGEGLTEWRTPAARKVLSGTVRLVGGIGRETFEVAVRDVNPGNETSLPIADGLHEAGVRFVFATGYGEQLPLPDRHQSVPVLQ